MKKVVLILFMVPTILFAQKPIKPNVNKAINSWKAGKLQEAKEIIDVCVTDPKLSLEGNTFYYKGLIYASLDTTTNATFKSLAENPLQTSVDAFAKAEQMSSGKKEYFVTDASGFPVLRSQQLTNLANHYIYNLGVKCYQEEDLECALLNFEKAQKVSPKDTTAFFYGGLVANALELNDKTIQYLEEYVKLGGTSKDAYSVTINIYNNAKNDKEKALSLVREAKTKFPNDTNFPRLEIGLLIDAGKEAEAKTGLQEAIAKEPNDHVLHFYLGYVNYRLKNFEEAKKGFEASLAIDSKYYEAQLFLSKLYYEEAFTIKKEMNALGISEKDKKRKFELDKVYTEKLKVALPFWEQTERLKPDDQEVLDALYSIYSDLDMQPQIKRIEKRYKELGLDN